METYWVPGVNRHGRHGRWAFAELTDIEAEFNKMIERNSSQAFNFSLYKW
jgi:type III restriction enzyme